MWGMWRDGFRVLARPLLSLRNRERNLTLEEPPKQPDENCFAEQTTPQHKPQPSAPETVRDVYADAARFGHPKRDPAARHWLGAKKGGGYRTPKTTARIQQYCIERDGLRCQHPQCPNPDEDIGRLEINHIDKNDGNNYSDNLERMHVGCNKAYKNDSDPRKNCLSQQSTHTQTNAPEQLTAPLERQRDEIREDPTTTRNQLTNLQHEPAFRKACLKLQLAMYQPGPVSRFMTDRQMRLAVAFESHTPHFTS